MAQSLSTTAKKIPCTVTTVPCGSMAELPLRVAGLDIADLRPQPDFRLQGTAFGSSNPIPFLGNPLPLNTLGACTSSSSSSTDARTPQESSAASTSSSIGVQFVGHSFQFFVMLAFWLTINPHCDDARMSVNRWLPSTWTTSSWGVAQLLRALPSSHEFLNVMSVHTLVVTKEI